MLHALHKLLAKKENRRCFKAYSEAVTFYTYELMSRI